MVYFCLSVSRVTHREDQLIGKQLENKQIAGDEIKISKQQSHLPFPSPDDMIGSDNPEDSLAVPYLLVNYRNN